MPISQPILVPIEFGSPSRHLLSFLSHSRSQPQSISNIPMGKRSKRAVTESNPASPLRNTPSSPQSSNPTIQEQLATVLNLYSELTAKHRAQEARMDSLAVELKTVTIELEILKEDVRKATGLTGVVKIIAYETAVSTCARFIQHQQRVAVQPWGDNKGQPSDLFIRGLREKGHFDLEQFLSTKSWG